MNTSNFILPYYDIPKSEFPIDRCNGNNAKRTLVLVEQKDFKEHGALLTKILRAVDLDFKEDVSFIALEKGESLSFLNTASVNEYDNVLLFGVAPTQLGLQTNPRLSMIRLENHTIIISTQLSHISIDAKAKRTLWEHLKEVFKS